MLNSIVFDLDGTLANISHRLHYVKNGKKNWEAFFEAIPADQPISEIVELAIDLIQIDTKPVLFATGRPESTRSDTEEWLRYNGIDVDFETKLFMRQSGDRRPDAEVKSGILERMGDAGFKPVLVFDDRQSVVDMWRREGIRVAQVAIGNF